jgi:hypothetical protein
MDQLKLKKNGDTMCDEKHYGPMDKESRYKMHHYMKHHAMRSRMNCKEDKMIFMKKVLEQLSDADKKKLLQKKMDMKISMEEQKADIMKEKKKIIAAKLDMKTSMSEQKLEMLKMIRDMLKD